VCISVQCTHSACQKKCGKAPWHRSRVSVQAKPVKIVTGTLLDEGVLTEEKYNVERKELLRMPKQHMKWSVDQSVCIQVA